GFEVDRFRRTPSLAGVGLLGMRERVAYYHGELDISSRPNAGVRIRVAVPLDAVGSEDGGPSAGAGEVDGPREAPRGSSSAARPRFAVPGRGVEKPVASMPGIAQRSVERRAEECRRLRDLGVPAVILFGVPERKDARGSGATDPDGIIPRALRAIRESAPGLVL